MKSLITTWSEGGHAVISNINGSVIHFYDCDYFLPGITQLSLPFGCEVKSIHAFEIFNSGKLDASIPKGLLLLSHSGDLFFLGNKEYIKAHFYLTIESTLNAGVELYKISTPPEIIDIANCENNIILLTKKGEMFLNDFANDACGNPCVKLSHHKQQQNFSSIMPIPDAKGLLKKDSLLSVAMGYQFFIVQTKKGRVYAFSGAISLGSFLPVVKVEKGFKTGVQVCRAKKTLMPALGAKASECVWLRLKFFDQTGKKSIKQMVTYGTSAWFLAETGEVFDASLRRKIGNGLSADKIAGTMNGFFWVQNNELMVREKIGEKAIKSNIMPLPSRDILEISTVKQRDGNSAIAVLKQMGSPFAGDVSWQLKIIYYKPAISVSLPINFNPVSARSISIPELEDNERQVAVWSNGALAINLGKRIYVRGGIESAVAEEQFGCRYQPAQSGQYINGGFDPSFDGQGQSLAKADKVFAGEHRDGRALFILSGQRLLTCGALAPYGLQDDQGVALGRPTDFTLIHLPLVPGASNTRITIDDIGLFDNAMIILSGNKIWLNEAAKIRYKISQVSEQTGAFSSLVLPELSLKGAQKYITQAKIILGADRFYLLMPWGEVFVYLFSSVSAPAKKTGFFSSAPASFLVPIVDKWYKINFLMGEQIIRMQLSRSQEGEEILWFLANKSEKNLLCFWNDKLNYHGIVQNSRIAVAKNKNNVIYVDTHNKVWISQTGSQQSLSHTIVAKNTQSIKIVHLEMSGIYAVMTYIADNNIYMMMIDCSREEQFPEVTSATIFSVGMQERYSFPAMQLANVSRSSSPVAVAAAVSKYEDEDDSDEWEESGDDESATAAGYRGTLYEDEF